MKKIDMIVDLQYGSTGKGLIAGYMAEKNRYDVCVTANMPNAGHTYIDSKGNKFVHKVLPNGVVSPMCDWALIGPGAVFDSDRMRQEIAHLRAAGYTEFRVGIHPNAVVLQDRHRDAEAANVKIGSTMQGSGAALIEKIRRDPEVPITAYQVWGEMSDPDVEVLTHDEYRYIIDNARAVLAEGAQGFSLGINERFYPYCTSRDCTPARFMADMALPLPLLRRVVGTARMHPIRVGNPEGGWSGPCYSDQTEISWGDLGVEEERTTVTNRVRRVFTFSKKQIEDAIWQAQPNEVFLNFVNYAPNQAEQVITQINDALCRLTEHGGKVRYIGMGPTYHDVRERGILDPADYTGEEAEDGVFNR